MTHLVHTRSGRRHRLAPTTLVGRQSSCELVLPAAAADAITLELRISADEEYVELVARRAGRVEPITAGSGARCTSC